MGHGGNPRRIHHDRRSRARSPSPPPADGGAIPLAVRRSAAEVEASVRRRSVPQRRGDGEVSSQEARSSAAEMAAASDRGRSVPPRRGDGEVSSQEARSSAAETAAASDRRWSMPPSRGDGGLLTQPRLESSRVACLVEQPQGKVDRLANMVHPELRLLLSSAMARMNKAVMIDGAFLEDFLEQLSNALLKAEFDLVMVAELQSNVRSAVDLSESGSKRRIHEVVLKQLCRLIDPEKKPGFVPKKGRPCVVLVIGLPGSGKTTSSVKFAYHHQRKGYSPSLICADTRGAKAFDRLKLMAEEAQIPCYGSCSESDPIKIAVQGVENHRKEQSDLIIIDAGGGQMSQDVYFSLIGKIYKATKPDLTILVVDAGAGSSAFDQAQTFTRKVSVGSVILTKMDDHSTGGGALNALAAVRLPVILLGIGKRIQEFQMFDVKLFSDHLLNYKTRSISIDTEDMHRIFDNLKLSETERRNAIDEVEKKCCNAYNTVLERHKLLAQQICALESQYKRLCIVLGEKVLKNADIQSATTLKERHGLLLTRIKRLERENDSRAKKLQVLLSKGLDSLDLLGVTDNEQREYKYMVENFSSYVEEANSLSTISLEKLETRVKELELKKAEHPDASRRHILRQSLLYIRGEIKDRCGLKDLIRMTVAWELKHREPIIYEKKKLLHQLEMTEVNLLQLNHDTSSHGDANKSDTEMGHSTSSSRTSRSDTDMSSGTSRSDSNDPDYSPESTESDIDMGHLVVSESSDST